MSINVATTTNNIGEIELDQGRYADAEARFRDVLRIADSAGHRLISAVSRGNLSRLAARSGRYSDADELLTDALATLDAIGSGPFLLEFQARRAELLILSGADPAEVGRLAEETLAQVRARVCRRPCRRCWSGSAVRALPSGRTYKRLATH